MSSLKRNSRCSASLVIRDKFFAICSSVLSSSLILIDICSFCSPKLSTMLFKASSSAAPLSTSGVTSGGVTLSVPGSFVLVEIRALTLCLDVFSLSISGSANALPSPLVLLSPVCGSELVVIAKSFDWPGVSR